MNFIKRYLEKRKAKKLEAEKLIMIVRALRENEKCMQQLLVNAAKDYTRHQDEVRQ